MFYIGGLLSFNSGTGSIAENGALAIKNRRYFQIAIRQDLAMDGDRLIRRQIMRINDLDSWLGLAAALGCGLIAGVFFAFSTFVMKALAKLPPVDGAAAMQRINGYAVQSGFLPAFLGTAAVCLVVGVRAGFRFGEPWAGWWIGGAAAYLIGTFLVTMLFNVPLNNALAAVSAESPEAPGIWSRYLKHWTAWNHFRTLAALAAMALLIVGLIERS